MSKLTDIARGFTGATSFVTGLLLLSHAAPVAAQRLDSDPRWQAWLGCWEAVEPDSAVGMSAATKPLICVIPAAGAPAVEMITFLGDSVTARERLEVTDGERQVSRDGCTGWERAQWSSNGQRVYLRSSVSCAGGPKRLSSGVMALSSDGEWIDVQGVTVGTSVGVRATRYRDVTAAVSLPAEIAAALRGSRMAVSTARLAAAVPLIPSDVVEASSVLEKRVLETWLAENGEGFELDAKQLVALQTSGVPSTVIDMMVALSYPDVFVLDGSQDAEIRSADPREYTTSGRRVMGTMGACSPYDYSYGYSRYGYSRYGYSPCGYSRYGYRYGYGYGYGYGGYFGNGIIVVRHVPSGTTEEQKRHGRVVNGRGYTPGQNGAPARRGTASGSKGQTGSSARPASGSSGGSSSTSQGSGSGRTAKPRPPR